MCVEFSHMSSWWFDCTEPSLTTSLQGKQGCRWFKTHRTSSNLLEPHIYTGKQGAGCLCTCLGWFKSIEPHRTFSNHIRTEIAGRAEFIHMSSGSTEPSLTTSLQGKQSVQGARALVRGGSSVSNLLKPSRTTS